MEDTVIIIKDNGQDPEKFNKDSNYNYGKPHFRPLLKKKLADKIPRIKRELLRRDSWRSSVRSSICSALGEDDDSTSSLTTTGSMKRGGGSSIKRHSCRGRLETSSLGILRNGSDDHDESEVDFGDSFAFEDGSFMAGSGIGGISSVVDGKIGRTLEVSNNMVGKELSIPDRLLESKQQQQLQDEELSQSSEIMRPKERKRRQRRRGSKREEFRSNSFSVPRSKSILRNSIGSSDSKNKANTSSPTESSSSKPTKKEKRSSTSSRDKEGKKKKDKKKDKKKSKKKRTEKSGDINDASEPAEEKLVDNDDANDDGSDDEGSVQSTSALSQYLPTPSPRARSPIRGILRESSFRSSKSLIENMRCCNLEDDDDDKSFKSTATSQSRRSVRFSARFDTKEMEAVATEIALDDLFYNDDELAEFRYEAFMEKVGLDPNDFD